MTETMKTATGYIVSFALVIAIILGLLCMHLHKLHKLQEMRKAGVTNVPAQLTGSDERKELP